MGKAWVCFVVACVSSAAVAGPTGLVLMPVADVLGHREGIYGYGVSGTDHSISKRYEHGHYITFGAFDRVEFGYDNDTLGKTVWNVKTVLFEGEKWAISGGLANCTSNYSESYAVSRLDFEKFRIHAGYYRDSADRFMAGVDFEVRPGLAFGIDHIGGREGATSAAIFWEIPKVNGFTLTLAYSKPNDRREADSHGATLEYGFRF